jgi:helicase
MDKGILADGNALIVAPTATGKSYIGRRIIINAVANGEPGTHVYLVPYRALASEMYDSFLCEVSQEGVEAVVRIATGDHTDPIYPHKTNILVATYERFASLLPAEELILGRVVVDEIHLIADPTRGVVVEGIIARMKSHKPPKSICALSAIITNPEELGEWLGVPVILGKVSDRRVEVDFLCEEVSDVDGTLADELQSTLQNSEQALIFCHSKASSQKLARDLKSLVGKYLKEADIKGLNELALMVAESEEEDVEELSKLLSGGIAFHHAGLSKDSRKAVEVAYRNRHLKAIACTPTLAAGVNLPAGTVVLRDIFRIEFVRGYPHKVMISVGEMLNMLGRAGRPGQVERGRAIALVSEGELHKDDLDELKAAISDGRGNPVMSRFPDSFDSLMRFLLAVVADKGEATFADFAKTMEHTYWYYEDPHRIDFSRSFKEDIMEDIPSFARVGDDMFVDETWLVPDGISGIVVSGPKKYTFTLALSKFECSCPAKSKWHRQEVCKHLACAIHYLLFGSNVEREKRERATYASAHHFRKTLDLGTKVNRAVELLSSWKLLERVPGGFKATKVGLLGANSILDLLLIRTAYNHLKELKGTPSNVDVAKIIVNDYFAEDAKRDRWLKAITPWLDEIDIREIKLPEKYRGDFERGLENLGQLATLYGEIADSIGRPEIAEICRMTRGCLQYGVYPELVPIISLRIPELKRARCRFLYDEKGIRRLEDLANAKPQSISGRPIPLAHAQRFVERAKQMWEARGNIIDAESGERDKEIDDFISYYQVDQLSLFVDNGVLRE